MISYQKTAVLEEYRYQTEQLDLTPKQAKKVRDKKKEITKDDYVFSDEKAKEYVPWLDRLWLNHDQTLNRIDNSINEMLKQGMRAQDIAEKMFPENAESMRKDNIPKAIREASNNVKRLARTEAARREDEMAEATFQASGVKQIKFVNEPGACKKCIPLQGVYLLDESPRIPKDTHPNCRCRRIKIELNKDNIDIIERLIVDRERQEKLKRNPNLLLPNGNNIIFPKEKFTKYLFNPQNKKGWDKGRQIKSSLGYDKNNYDEFINALSQAALKYPVKEKGDNGFGVLYEQKIMLYNNEKPYNLVVSYIVPKDKKDVTKLVTVYIKELSKDERKTT